MPPPTHTHTVLVNSHVRFNVSVSLLSRELLCIGGVGNLADDRWLVPLTRSGWQSERKIRACEREREREREKIYPGTAGASVLNNTLRRKEMGEIRNSFLFAGHFKGTAGACFHYSSAWVICVLNHFLNRITLDLNKIICLVQTNLQLTHSPRENDNICLKCVHI